MIYSNYIKNTKKERIKHDQNINCTNCIHEKQNTNYKIMIHTRTRKKKLRITKHERRNEKHKYKEERNEE